MCAMEAMLSLTSMDSLSYSIPLNSQQIHDPHRQRT